MTASTTKLTLQSGFKLNSGHVIPLLGYGVYQTPREVASDDVQHAIRSGYRHVDSAAAYRNEAASAAGMTASGVPREQLFFTSKIRPRGLSYETARATIDQTLEEIGSLGYVDLFLIHAPYGGRQARLGAWKALVEGVEEGKIKSIGVSNYGVHHLNELEAYIKETDAREGLGKGGVLSVNQIEVHPWLQHHDIVEWCQKRGVLVQAWGPLARATRWEDERLQRVAKSRQRTPAQVLIRWSLQRGFSPLPKSVTPSRIEENANVYDFELSSEDMKILDTDEYSPSSWDPTVSND